MEYKNTKTGATFSSPCKISGGNWALAEEVEESIGQDIPRTNDKVITEGQDEQGVNNESKTGDETFDSITKEQIMQELDAFGVPYDKRAKKQVLYDLMMQQGG